MRPRHAPAGGVRVLLLVAVVMFALAAAVVRQAAGRQALRRARGGLGVPSAASVWRRVPGYRLGDRVVEGLRRGPLGRALESRRRGPVMYRVR